MAGVIASRGLGRVAASATVLVTAGLGFGQPLSPTGSADVTLANATSIATGIYENQGVQVPDLDRDGLVLTWVQPCALLEVEIPALGMSVNGQAGVRVDPAAPCANMSVAVPSLRLSINSDE